MLTVKIEFLEVERTKHSDTTETEPNLLMANHVQAEQRLSFPANMRFSGPANQKPLD
jgi:hypothetical protein